jgi:hypothetical protein
MSLARFKCLVNSCKKDFISVKNRDNHMNKFHNDNILNIVNTALEDANDDIMYSSYLGNVEPIQTIFKCWICTNENKKNNYKYKNVNTLNIHIKKQHPQYEVDLSATV